MTVGACWAWFVIKGQHHLWVIPNEMAGRQIRPVLLVAGCIKQLEVVAHLRFVLWCFVWHPDAAALHVVMPATGSW